MNGPRILRLAAIVIAAAGIVDPVLTLSRPAPQPLAITIVGDHPADAAYESAARLQAGLSDLFDARVATQSPVSDANPCSVEGACIVISDGAAPRRLAATGLLGGVRIAPERKAAVALRSISAPARTDPDARGVIEVAVESKDAKPVVRVFDGDVLVGESETSRIEWTPIAQGLRALRVTTADDEVQVAVAVAPQRHVVVFYEPQPTWMGTFVRRALETDPRFALRTQARVSKAITVASAATPLDVATLDRTNARVVIVSALEQLTSGDVSTLQQFMSRRGGSVIALVDRTPAGPGRALVPFAMNERREAEPVAIGLLKGSEFSTFEPADAVATILAARGEAPVILATPIGNGRLVASGASDSWRFRGDGSFNAFWQSLIADAADAAGDALTMTLDKRISRPHDRVRVEVDWRPLGGIAGTIDARAAVVCENNARPIRLWPGGAPGRFDGEFLAPDVGDCRVTATLNDATASTPFMVRNARLASDLAPADQLSTAVVAHGGVAVAAGDEATLITALRSSAAPRDISTQLHPMRSPWWIIPFAACLGGEWWLRRRHGSV